MNEPAITGSETSCGSQRAATSPQRSPYAAIDDAAKALAQAGLAPVMGPGFDPEWPPYLPGRVGGLAELDVKTIPMDSIHAIGLHYDVHSLYGWSESRAGAKVLEAVLDQRPLLISRSTFPSHSITGAGHWLGDNTATWHDIRMNIAGVLQFSSLYQIPLVGADTCGFNGDTTAELCTRWMALSAILAPFYRNHNTIGAIEQAPYVFGEPYTSAIRMHMNERMRLLPMWAAAFAQVAQDGTPPVRPLFFDYPTQAAAGGDLSFVDDQAMVGPGLLVAPVIVQGATSRFVFFPRGSWFNWWNGQSVSSYLPVPAGGGANVSVPCGLFDQAPMFLRGGTIVPVQGYARNATFARRNPFGLTVAMDPNTSQAQGSLFWDDGQSIGTLQTGAFVTANLSAFDHGDGTGTVTVYPSHVGVTPPSTAVVATVQIYGFSGASGTVSAQANGAPISASFNATTGVATFSLGTAASPIHEPLKLVWNSRG
jgi:alpha-glucosidase (family GH31 glycosyl hydrolase)